MENSTTFELNLPGFRFHPTEEEFLNFYLKNMIYQKKPLIDVISFLNIYHHDPWDLPGLAKTRTGEREWYFFVPRDRKKGKQGRPNRTTENGFWKATGSDRKVISLSNPKKMIGMKKTMVFYRGRAPRGCKTDWVMNEFRLPDTPLSPTDIVLCKIYRKATSLKVLEQRAAVAVEEETLNIISQLLLISPPSLSSPSSSSSSMDHQDLTGTAPQMAVEKEENGQQQQALEEEENDLFLVGNYYHSKKKEEEEEEETAAFGETIGTSTGSGIRLPFGQEKLENLLVPTKSSTVDWTQDPFWTQLRSPWLDNWAFYANALSTSNEYF